MFDNFKDSNCPKCVLEDEDLYHVIYECSAYNGLRSRLIPMIIKPDGRHLQLNISKLKCKTIELIQTFLLAIIDSR